MKTEKKRTVRKYWRGISALQAGTAAIILFLFVVSQSCQKYDAGTTAANQGSADLKQGAKNNSWKEVDLVSDVNGGANITDPNLVNAWGLAFGSSGAAWISSNEEGLTTIYDAEGNTLLSPVSLPFNGSPSNPTGCVFNTTTDFVISGTGTQAFFIFSTENGSLNAWNSGSTGPQVADRSSKNAVYKGLAIAATGGANYLYATDFHNAAIDVFDKNFKYVSSITLTDPNIPNGYAPFGIRNIAGELWVTYAKQMPDKMDDDPGPGRGFVDVYDPSGTLLQRFASHGVLNSPWGIVKKPGANMYLIGNFGDGKINVYDGNGNFQYSIKDKNGNPVVIDGLWAIDFPQTIPEGDIGRMYFTAGPEGESHGLYGYLTQSN